MEKKLQSQVLFLSEIKRLLETKDFSELKKALRITHPVDLANNWKNFNPQEKILIFKFLDTTKAIEVFEELELEERYFIMENLEEVSLTEILADMTSHEKIKLFSQLPEQIKKKMNSSLKKEEAELLKKMGKYPEGTAGKLMSTDFITLSPQQTVKEALEKVSLCARLHKIEKIDVIYVTEEDNQLIGAISLRELITAPSQTKIAEIMTPVHSIKVNAKTGQKEVAKQFSKYHLTTEPVVDDENHLIGVIPVERIVDVIEEEATKEITRLGGISRKEFRAKNIFQTIQMRLPWLIGIMVLGLVISWIIGKFEQTLSKAITLAAFLPIIINMGGNIGTQASTVMVRGIALGHIDMKKAGRTIFKELIIGLLIGIICGIFLALFTYLRYGEGHTLMGIAVGLGICSSMAAGATFGALMPIIFEKIGIDPAVATAPLVTTFVDIFGVTSYLVIATVILI